MKRILFFPFLLAALIVQLGLLSSIRIASGNMDLVFLVVIAWALKSNISLVDVIGVSVFSGLMVGFVSSEPWVFVVGFYSLAALTAYYLRSRVWNFSILTMFLSTVVFSLSHMLFFSIYLQITGSRFQISDGFNLVVLPSLLLNVIAVLPVYLLVAEVQRWIYPLEEEV